MLTQERLRELLHYDPETGAFTWLCSISCLKKGSVAGTPHKCKVNTYLRITIDKKSYFAHRLAWFYMTGAWPEDQIDHRDRDSLNNRWENLRACTIQENNRNRVFKPNAVGLRGVYVKYTTRGATYRAAIRVDNKLIHLGTFTCPHEAHAVYLIAVERFYGDFTFVNLPVLSELTIR